MQLERDRAVDTKSEADKIEAHSLLKNQFYLLHIHTKSWENFLKNYSIKEPSFRLGDDDPGSTDTCQGKEDRRTKESFDMVHPNVSRVGGNVLFRVENIE